MNYQLLYISEKLMTQWTLESEYLKSDMDRINNPEYFMKDFECRDLLSFFSQVVSMDDVNKNRDSINLFYDYFLSMNDFERSLYVQIKWIIVLHQIIQVLKENSPLYGFTLKALQVGIENVSVFQDNDKPFQKYLMTNLVRPYLQYLSKLCLLNMSAQTSKYDQTSALSLSTKPQQQPFQQNDETEGQKQSRKQSLNIKLIDWYRKYNFISGTLQTFQTILIDQHRFFATSFPFLNNIGGLIVQDLNSVIFKLKYVYRSLKRSNVTLIELDQLDGRLKMFSLKNIEYSGKDFDSYSKITQFSKKDLQQFMQSPLKPGQLRLYTKQSLGTPLSALVKQ